MVYQLLKSVLPKIFRLLFRCEITGQANIPQQGGVIIAANHVSNWDPPLAAAFALREVHFMAKQELFAVPVLGWLINQLHAFPVKRGGTDRTAVKQAIWLLTSGHCLGLFPEGTRSVGGVLKKPEPGIALIAIKAGVPVIPTAIIGTNRIFKVGSLFPKLTVRYGKPIQLPAGKADKALLQDFAEQIMMEIDRLIIDPRESEAKG